MLFAKVRPESGDRFVEFLEVVRARLAGASEAVSVSDKFDFTPHMTLCKVRQEDAMEVSSCDIAQGITFKDKYTRKRLWG